MTVGGVGELVAKKARELGLILLVDTRGLVRYYPTDRMRPWFLRLLTRHSTATKNWLITEAITVE